MPIETDIVGKWTLESSENFDGYLTEVGIGFVTRAIAIRVNPILEFIVKDGEWTMKSTSTFKNYVLNFTLGKELDEKTVDGRCVLMTYTVENDRLIQVEKGKNGGKDSRIERWVQDGKLQIQCDCNGVKSLRVYAKAA